MDNSYARLNFPMFDLAKKEESFNVYVQTMLCRTQSLFEWSGLPKTIPQREIELLIQTAGHCCVTSVNGDLWALGGGFGGEPDPYYLATKYTVANPALKFSKVLTINDDCVIVKNDNAYMGLLPMFSRYATQMVENDLSMLLADVNTRIVSLITATDDATYKAGLKYIEDIKAGKMGVAMTNEFLEGLKTQPFATTGMNNQLTQLIEYHQYLKGGFWNDIGLESAYNMKREAINSSESGMNTDTLYPFVHDMLKCRKQACDEINEMFGTDISVDFASIWKQKEKEMEVADELIEQQLEANAEPEQPDEPEVEKPEQEEGESDV